MNLIKFQTMNCKEVSLVEDNHLFCGEDNQW